MDSKTLTEGVPAWLLGHEKLGARAWKRKGSQLSCSEGHFGFALCFSKRSMRTVEPWQRVGVLMNITLEVTHAGVATMLGMSPKKAIVSVQIQPRDGSMTNGWGTTEETVDTLAAAVGKRLEGILDELVRVLAHPAGFESLAAYRYDRLAELEKPDRRISVETKVREGLGRMTLKGCGASLLDDSRGAPFFAAALLLRHDYLAAEAVGTPEERARGIFDGSKSVDVWPSLLEEIERQRAAKVTSIAIPAADWDFAALDARLDAAVVEALLVTAPAAASAPAVATAPALAPDQPAKRAAPMPAPATPFGRLCALLAMPAPRLMRRGAEEELEQTQWAAVRNYLHQRTLSEAELAALGPLLDRIDGAFRPRGTWSAGTNSSAWNAVRHAFLPRSDDDQAATITHASTFDAFKVDWSTCPDLEELADLNCKLAAPVVAALGLTKLRRLNLQGVADEVLTEVASSEGAKRLESLVANHHKPYDKSIKTIAKSLPSLKRLQVEAMSPAAAKALSKSAHLQALESFGLRLGTAKQVEALTPVLRALPKLSELVWEAAVDASFVLPPTLESLSIGTAFNEMAALNPAMPALRRLRLNAGASGLEALSAWTPTRQLEEFSIAFQGDFEPLLRADWRALQMLEVDAFVGKNFDSLLAWIESLTALRYLRLRFPLTAEQATRLCAALAHLEAIDIKSPHMLAAMSTQAWPNLRSFVIDVRESTGVVLPCNDAFADAVLERMPSLSAFAVRNAANEISPEKLAELEAALAAVCIGTYWP